MTLSKTARSAKQERSDVRGGSRIGLRTSGRGDASPFMMEAMSA